jgi:hypothetical protein
MELPLSHPAKIALLVSLLWAVVALAVQMIRSWGGGRRDHSERAGSIGRGVVYNFTVAMMPAHKESVRHHPVKFAIGMLMHAGVIVAIIDVVLLLVAPDAGRALLAWARPLYAAGLVAGVILLARRGIDRNLRAMSVPDDYLSNVMTCGLLAFAALTPAEAGANTALIVYATALFVYLPLGKLRHVVFFFLARADYGRRLGHRGVYPPAAV